MIRLVSAGSLAVISSLLHVGLDPEALRLLTRKLVIVPASTGELVRLERRFDLGLVSSWIFPGGRPKSPLSVIPPR
jgi:hypothetical protein